jgi:hypothetical protein
MELFRIKGYNTEKSSPLYYTTPQVFFRCSTIEEIFLHCGIQLKKFSSVVGYNGGGCPPLWDTMEEVFGIQWSKMIDTMQNDIYIF